MTAGMNIRPFEPNRDFWDGRRVAVTGATGFVGNHLTSALAALGARVVVLVRDTVPSSPIRDGGGRGTYPQSRVRPRGLGGDPIKKLATPRG
jgi:nucleoside-diphosphate-sugar epimerase